ncbi:MAG: alpha-L-fucosidase [Treponema sp.]|jgi:alpha-L-fucosidase|nr:alpha-L-fucosidase [Treponema sp.]
MGIAGRTGKDYQKPPETDWFYSGGLLGLFIHFGISTVSAEGDLSWAMIDGKPWGDTHTITPRQYWEQAKSFNPAGFDPENWLKAAKDAGFSYAVFTSRHHDGFSNWPSDYGYLNTKNYMGGRDLVGEYMSACRKTGIAAGLYYSPPDWFVERYHRSFMYGSGTKEFPGRPHKGMNHEVLAELTPVPKNLKEDYAVYVSGQVRELLTRYKPDILWFDGSFQYDGETYITAEEVFSLQPNVIINDRNTYMGGGYGSANFEGPMPETRGDFFECCDIWTEGCGWGWTKYCTGFRSARWLYDRYCTARGLGGNFLINAGPMADGTLSPVYYQRLRELKEILRAEK